MKSRPMDKAWAEFIAHVQPNEQQLEQFEKYADYLLSCNEQFNLTAITDLPGVVRQHFEDSVALGKFIDLNAVTTIADIGTGAGFPALPLKIMYPHLKVILIEVTQKKQQFLHDTMQLLGLTDIEICGLDWRTFVRNTDYQVDVFVTRAALADLELIRMFRPACPYNQALLVYWASKDWLPHEKAVPLMQRTESYRIGHKERRLVFLKALQPA
jgi:16S rRNA (guanine(527)-N(7))-methyltransferase RsmG